MAVIGALTTAPEPLWGLDLSRRSGVLAGGLYTTLDELEREGLVYSEWIDHAETPGGRRRVYSWAGGER
jgi:predicted transcriptional regulator